MSFRSAKSFSRTCAGLAVAGVLAAGCGAADARSRNVFAALEGVWSGAGSVTSSNGQTERVRCRANYGPGAAENVLIQNMVCAGASFRFNLSGQYANQGGAVSGQWSETSRGVGGALRGSVRGNKINTTVSSEGFTASLNVTLSGNTHSLTIQPQNSDISAVQISFRRAGG